MMGVLSIISPIQSQQIQSKSFAVWGTQWVSVSHYSHDTPSFSLSGGLGKYWVINDSLKKGKITFHSFKIYTSASISLDRFSVTDYYRYSTQNDRIDFTKVSIDLESQFSFFEKNWPLYSSLLWISGISITPLFFGDERIDNQVHRVNIQPQWFNFFVGLGAQTSLSKNWMLYTSLKTYLIANQEWKSFDFHDVINLEQPNLFSVTISIRYLW